MNLRNQFDPNCDSAIRLEAVVVAEPHQRLVGEREQRDLPAGAMLDPRPPRRHESVALLPGGAPNADQGFARAFGHQEDAVRGSSDSAASSSPRRAAPSAACRAPERNTRTVEAFGSSFAALPPLTCRRAPARPPRDLPRARQPVRGRHAGVSRPQLRQRRP